MESVLLVVGIVSSGLLVAMLLWSFFWPNRRLWPPTRRKAASAVITWALTVAVFASVIGLGISGWGEIGLPGWLRWGVGLPLVLVGNAIVWAGIVGIGIGATSGAKDKLVTTGLYRYSRNPQYVADIAILVGFALLTAAWATVPVAAMGVLALILAPFAEEPWLQQVYGDEYRTYRATVRRFF